ncbi:aminotransferase class V-fold PLP-dependent enzyme [Actinomadura sp. ATCC 31491]|uniref:Kynureninase n=1 Tax=Actinomadura luzonensis TaxID=2805427 RepID=A0ABT0FNI4_9ACTN|nr:aminotransferase class V-fold PLP-dependent enzyme [Actinomadura luzonensis]MCK2213910.1 aminotransferase class V-fold PLP-dependent enzyme [Actinomadura luzonensis]
MIDRDRCLALDAADPLRAFREEFVLPEGVIYLVGNSLGALPRRAADRVRRAVEQEWGGQLVGGWNQAGWYDQPLALGDRIAPLIGAGPGEVVVGNSTSIAIYQAVAAALRLRPDRRVIVSDARNFPTDHYVVQGLAGLLGGYEIRDAAEGRFDDAAVVLLSEVDYRTGARADVPAVTARAHEAGALMVWDLCHSVGAMPVDVSAADFAVGCTYKYLNAGPGAPAFLYVSPRHHATAENVLQGWHGHAAPFAFETGYRPAEGIRRFAVGTPHVLSSAALDAALEIWERVPMDLLRAKSMALTSLFVDLVGDLLELVSPADAEARGSQVSLRHPDGYPVMRALIDRGVHGDFRAPDILRFGFAPLYIRYVDVHDAAATLREVLDKELWRDERYAQRLAVT